MTINDYVKELDGEIDDFRNVEFLTKALIREDYIPKELFDVANSVDAKQKLGYITDVALSYALQKNKDIKQLKKLWSLLHVWKQGIDLPETYFNNITKSMDDYLNKSHLSKKWNVISHFSSYDFNKA